MYSFNGTFTYRLDDKNRIRIPAKFKKDLGSDYKLTLAPGNCLSVLPQEEYAKILEGFGRVPYFDEAASVTSPPSPRACSTFPRTRRAGSCFPRC